MPNELELIALKTEFELYLAFTKRLVLNLPSTDDRTLAALWLQKLRTIDDDNQKKLRNEHLKLLLFALHRRAMVGVFSKPPPENELESFHDGLTLLEMTRELIEINEKALANAGGDSGECPLPPVVINISADMKEYCATQTVPKFGTHVFYAVSNEPIQMWTKPANCVYPDATDIPNHLQWELSLSKITDNVLEKQAEADRLAAEAEETKEAEESDVQVLPKVTLDPCPGTPVFKWANRSNLTIHQSYDFSDVGVAEDMEAQGQHQLELDEVAYSILDHSLPGRQRVIIRDPYFKDLPPDISERRYHGVIEKISEDEESTEEDEEEEEPPPPSPSPLPPPEGLEDEELGEGEDCEGQDGEGEGEDCDGWDDDNNECNCLPLDNYPCLQQQDDFADCEEQQDDYDCEQQQDDCAGFSGWDQGGGQNPQGGGGGQRSHQCNHW